MAYFQHADYDSGNNLTFEVTPDIGQETGKEYANTTHESYSGVEYIVQAHSGKKTFTWSWSNISSSFKTKLENFRNVVQGSFKSFTYNDGSTSYAVRLTETSLAFNENNYQRFSTNINLREIAPS
jgi:hypothetical protein